jgi:hypothetical protein
MKIFPSEGQTEALLPASVEAESTVLGVILLNNDLYRAEAHLLNRDCFSLDSNRRIFSAIVELMEDGKPVDILTVADQLGKDLPTVGGTAYIASLTDGTVKRSSVAHHVNSLRKKAALRQLIHTANAFATRASTDGNDVDALLAEAGTAFSKIAEDTRTGSDWRALFHTHEEIVNAPSAPFAIEGFLQEEGITLIGGLAGHGKTLTMLAMVRALLEGGKLFHHFAVNEPAERVIYLIPEAGLGPFSTRLKAFHLLDYIREGRLFVRTLSATGQLSLTDSRLLQAVHGADIFLDTAIRFMTGDENSAAEQKLFADTLFGLQRAGTRTITGAHHSPKGFAKDNVMTLENVLRGSGDIGAMLVTCWGLSQIDANANRIYVQNVKARDFQPCEPFIIQGRPSIDQMGYFELTEPPGFAGTLSEHKDRKPGRPSEKGEKFDEALELKNQGAGIREIAKKIGVSKSTVANWFSDDGGVQ